MINERLSYTDLKAIIAKKNLAWQHREYPDKYKLFALDNDITYIAHIYKSPITVGGLDASAEAANLVEFETNYKPNSNFPTGERTYPFSTPDFIFGGDGILVTCAKTTTTNIDFLVPGAAGTVKYLNGATVITKDAVFGDYAGAIIIDKDNVLGYGANTPLASYITKWYINPNMQVSIQTPYAGKIPAGVYVRISYTSVGTTNDVGVAVNYLLHSPL